MTRNYIPVHSFATNLKKRVYLPQKRKGGGGNSQELSFFDYTCSCINLLFETIFETKIKKNIFPASSTDACTDFLYYQYESFGIPYTSNIFSSYWVYRQPIIAFSLKRSKEKMASILVAFDSFSWQLKHIQWWSSLAFDLARDVYFLISRNPGIY